MKKILIVALIALICLPAVAQKKGKNPLMNWYNKDLTTDKVFGVSTEKAYKELLKGKTSTPVIVAIIDGGTDIKHEDLKEVLWTNPDEIAGNGIDDDNNGYIDDIHGWNFIGGANGENVHWDNYEATRIYRKYKDVYEGGGKDDDPLYAVYKKAKAKFETGLEEAKGQAESLKAVAASYGTADSIIRKTLGKETYTLKELGKIKSDDYNVTKSVSTVKYWMGMGITYKDLAGYADMLQYDVLYRYNLDYDPRSIVGDNWEDNSNRTYGNNDVCGPDPGHGTFVAGQVGAKRKNGIGVDGIADNVQLMIIRVVPDGDERDKDVANGIRYAIENGAKVINMSFGKSYSPQKQFVDEVLPLADKYDVLLVHAAGNDGADNDVVTNYPENGDGNGNKITKCWMTVGASASKNDKDLAASFSNYGKKNVDVFAPGVDIWGLEPGDKYGSASGTSMAAPVVSGVAAVIRAYYPKLTAAEVREIIMKSAVPYDGMVNKPSEDGKSSQVNFSELSVSGGIANLYNALKLAEQMSSQK